MVVNLVLIGLFRFFIPRFFMEQLMELESVTIVQEFQTFELYMIVHGSFKRSFC